MPLTLVRLTLMDWVKLASVNGVNEADSAVLACAAHMDVEYRACKHPGNSGALVMSGLSCAAAFCHSLRQAFCRTGAQHAKKPRTHCCEHQCTVRCTTKGRRPCMF